MEPEDGTAAVVGAEDGEVETVHARGPGLIGMEDMGPQTPGSGLAGGLDLEGALGRRGEGESMQAAVGREGVGQNAERKEDERDGDGDVVIADADGVAEGEPGAGEMGLNRGVDAADGTSL